MTSTKELEEAGEDTEGVITSKSKLRSKVKSLSGVDILTDTGAYKSTYDILLEISKVWKQMSDIDQSALLELIAGKTRSNTAASILGNTKDLEEALKSAQNAEGSALKENTKYLDSIEGRTKLLDNAVQALWEDTLNSDVIKFFVTLGTNVVQLIDKIGAVKSAIAGVVAGVTILKNKGIFTVDKDNNKLAFMGVNLNGLKAIKQEFQDYNSMIGQGEQATRNWVSSLDSGNPSLVKYLSGLNGAQATMKGYIGSLITGKLSTIGLTIASTALNVALTMGLSLAIQGIILLLEKFFGWIHDLIHPTEALHEKLDELNSEISEMKSNLDSLNDKLETTKDRMSELSSMDSLSFVEEEELKNLKLQNAELERQIELQKMMLKAKEEERKNTAKGIIKTDWNSEKSDKVYSINDKGIISKDDFWSTGKDTQEALDVAMQKYQQYADAEALRKNILLGKTDINFDDGISETERKQLWYAVNGTKATGSAGSNVSVEGWKKALENGSHQQTMDYISAGIEQVFGDMSSIISDNDLDYSMNDSAINSFLDQYYAYQQKWANAQGISSKSSVIGIIFDETSSDAIKQLKTGLEDISKSGKDEATKLAEAQVKIEKALENTNGEYERLKTTMDTVGVSAEELARYFIASSSAPDMESIGGIVGVYQQGIDALNKFKDKEAELGIGENGESINWNNLFTTDDGNIVADQLKVAAILQGSTAEVREEFTSLVEAVQSGEMDIQTAINRFNVSGLLQASKLIEEQFVELNKASFKGLEDEISGFIDTTKELSSSLENVASSMDLVYQAQQQMASSGRISVKTALELMESTDRWNEILNISNGTIELNTNAEEVLVQSKLDLIKANIDQAITETQLHLAQAGAVDVASTQVIAAGVTSQAYAEYSNAVANYTAVLAGFQAAIGSLFSGNLDVIGSFRSAYDVASKMNAAQNKQAATDYQAKLAQLQAQKQMLSGIGTVGDFKNNYDYDKTPGDKYKDNGGGDDDAFDRAMTYWENRISASEARYEQVQNEVDLLEKRGKRAGEEYYKEQLMLTEQKRSLLEAQQATAEQYLNSFEEGSEDWWSAAKTMNDLENELDQVTASVLDLQDAIANVHWDNITEFADRIDTLHDSLSNIRDMFDEDDFFDEMGGFTEDGVAALGTYIQELEIYENELKGINNELSNLNRPYAGNEDYYAGLGLHSEQELYDKYSELQSQQNDYQKGIKDTQDAIVDMYSSQIDAVEAYHEELTSAYSDYISYLKETLDAERSLYEFKKNIQQQSKDIAETERKLASLSGSTSQADIAERRRLQKTLYDQRNELETSYRDNARDAQIAALEEEQAAYEDATTRYIETLKTTLKNASKEISGFMSKVSALVLSNSDTVLKKYQETGLEMDEALTRPWEVAIEKLEEFGGPAGLGVMNSWTAQGGFFDTFMNTASAQLQTPWAVGIEAVNVFSDSVAIAMGNVLAAVQSNVDSAAYSLASLYAQIQDTAAFAAEVGSSGGGYSGGGGGGGGSMHASGTTSWVNGHNFTNEFMTVNGTRYVKDTDGYWLDAKYVPARTSLGTVQRYKYYATGTTGTKKDQWAITDEPQYGDELTLVPGKNGILQYMKKGTGVVPADLTKSLMDIGAVGLDGLMNANQFNSGINIINTAVTKPNYEFNFDALVKADHIDENAVPALKKMVAQELDKFAKQLNYAIKKV